MTVFIDQRISVDPGGDGQVIVTLRHDRTELATATKHSVCRDPGVDPGMPTVREVAEMALQQAHGNYREAHAACVRQGLADAEDCRSYSPRQVAPLREALRAAVAELEEHGREYQHRTPPEFIDQWKALLARAPDDGGRAS